VASPRVRIRRDREGSEKKEHRGGESIPHLKEGVAGAKAASMIDGGLYGDLSPSERFEMVGVMTFRLSF